MSKTTKEINRITGAIIGICGKLIIYALVILLLFECVTRAYDFGHEVFDAQPVAEAPGTDVAVTLTGEVSVQDVAGILKEKGLIRNKLAFCVQARFYEYEFYPGDYTLNTSMTTKEMMNVMNVEPKESEGEE